MFINKNSLIVNGINLGDYIVEAKYGYNKIWGDDAGRENLAGTMSGTLKGIFPKIIVQFRKLTKSELETIVPILDSARQSLTYYDPKKRAMTTMETYTGDYEIVNKFIIGKNGHKNEGFQVSFISIRRRS